MNAVYIREMSEKDVPDIVEIEKASYTMPWSETSFFSEIYSRHSITRVAELDNTIIAYICAKQIADEGHLLNLTVHPDYRRQGIAKMLFNNVVKDLKANGCRFLYLEVRASNYAAKRLYEGLGFKTVSIRKNYYIQPAENALIMMLELGEPSPAQSIY